MPIDLSAVLSAVNWLYVVILCLFAFVAALLGSLIAFRSRFVGAIIAGILFGAAYVYWTYYPHPALPGPIGPGPITTAATSAASAPVAAAPVRPANPVTTITPEQSPPPAGAPPVPAGTK